MALISILIQMMLPAITPLLDAWSLRLLAGYNSIKDSKSQTYRFEATNSDLQAFFGDKKAEKTHRFAILKDSSKFDLRLLDSLNTCPPNPEGCISESKVQSPLTKAPLIDFDALEKTTSEPQLVKNLRSELLDIQQYSASLTPDDEAIRAVELVQKPGEQDKVHFLRSIQNIDTQIDYQIIQKGVKQSIHLLKNSPFKYQFLLSLDDFQVIKNDQNYTLVNKEQSVVIQISKPIVRNQAAKPYLDISQDPRGVILEVGVDPDFIKNLKDLESYDLDVNFIIGGLSKTLEKVSNLIDHTPSSPAQPLPVSSNPHSSFLFDHTNSLFKVGFGSKDVNALTPSRTKMVLLENTSGASIQMQLLGEKPATLGLKKSVKLTDSDKLNEAVEMLTSNNLPKFRARQAKKAAALAESLTAEEVKDNLDLEYKVFPQGIKEDLILKKAPESTASARPLTPERSDGERAQFEYALSVDGVTPAKDQVSGIWYFVSSSDSFEVTNTKYDIQDTKYKRVFHLPKAFAEDATGIRTDNVDLDIKPWDGCSKILSNSKTCYKVKVTLDPEFLQNAQYPVIVDPSLSVSDSTTSNFNITNNDTTTAVKNRVLDTGSGGSPVLTTYDPDTISLWHFDEGTGSTVVDSAPNGLNNSGALQSTSWTSSGKFGSAVTFTSSANRVCSNGGSGTSCVDDDDYDLGTTGSFTVEFWFKSSSASARVMVAKRNTDSSDGWYIYLSGSGTVFSTLDGASGAVGPSTADIGALNGSWHYIALVVDRQNQNAYLYADGVRSGAAVSTASIGSMDNAIPFTVGNRGDGNTSFAHVGEIDEVRVSRKVRTEGEIATYYRATKPFDIERRPYSVFTSRVFDLTGQASLLQSLTWSENGVKTGDGETLSSATGLVSQWNFNGTSGTTATSDAGSCGSSCNGTLTNFASTGSQDAAAMTGWTSNNRRWGTGALMFDGSTSAGSEDYVSVTDNNSLDLTSAITIETWVRFNETTRSTGNYDWQAIVTKATYANAYGLMIYNGSTKDFTFYHQGVGAGSSGFSWTDREPGVWYHIAATWDGSTTNLYVNGVLRKTTSASGTLTTNASNLLIGKSTTGPYPLDGQLDSLRIYNRAITSAEVLSNYNATNLELQTRSGTTTTPNDGTWEAWKPTTNETQMDSMDGPYQYSTSESGLVAYYPMDETSSYPYTRVTDAKSTSSYASFATDTTSNLQNGLSAYWNLNEASGTRVDSVFSSNLTDNNTVTSNTGKVSNAAEFTAANSEYLSTTSNAAIAASTNASFTISAWVYLASTGTARTIVSKGSNYLLYYTGTTFQFYALDSFSNIGGVNSTSFGSPSANTWYHVVGWFNSGEGSLNIKVNNGTTDTSAALSPGSLKATTSDFRIGAGDQVGTLNQFWNGRIDEIGIWKRTLSSQEITDLYNSGNSNALTSASGNHGYPVGSTIVDGKFGKARGFDGSDDYIAVNDSSTLEPSGSVTAEAWIYPMTVSGNHWILEKGSTNSTNGVNGYGLHQLANQIRFYLVTGTNTENTLTSDITISANTWYHIVGTYDGSTQKLYINGAVKSQNVTGSIDYTGSDQQLRIGRTHADTLPFDGTIDEVRIYSSGLSASTVQDHANEGIQHQGLRSINAQTDTSIKYEGTGSQRLAVGAPKVDSKTVGLWHMDETNSTGPIYDSTGVRKFTTDTTGNLTSGLKDYWNFDEPIDNTCAGGVFDFCDKVSKIDAQVSGDSVVSVAGKLENARDLGGSSDYILTSTTEITGATVRNQSKYSVSGWFMVDTMPTNGNYFCVYCENQGSGQSANLRLGILVENAGGTGQAANVANSLTFSFRDTEGGALKTINTGASTITTGTWYHYVATYDSDNDQQKLYLNGTAFSATNTMATVADVAPNNVVTFGLHPNGTAATNFNGKIDEFGVWHGRVLSASEVSDLYNSGNGNIYSGTAGNNGILYGATAVDGLYTKARSFSGSSQYAAGPDSSSLTATSNFSIEAWVYPKSVGGTVQYIFSKATDATTEYAMYLHTDGELHCGYTGDGDQGGTGAALVNNKWQYVVCVHDDTNDTDYGYINGAVDWTTTGASANSSDGTGGWAIGSFGGATKGSYFNGNIDEVRVSTIARSYDEIQESYRAGRDQRIGRNLSSTDLSSKLNTQYAIAADRPGTYMEATIGESAFTNYEPDTNTLGLWHFEEGNGTGAYAKDSSGNGKNGTPTNGPTQTQGKLGKAYNFDGSNDSVDTNNVIIPASGDFTLSAWIRPTDFANTNAIFGQYAAAQSGRFLFHTEASSGKLQSQIGGVTLVLGSTALSTTAWTYVTLTRTGSTWKQYNNGVLEGTATDATSVYVGANTRIGIGDNSNNFPFKGSIDEPRIDNTVRTADEIRQAFEVGKRTHPITIDFASSLQAAYTSGTSVTINNNSGQTKLSDSLKVGDTILVKENVGGVEYIGSAVVSKIDDTSSVYGTVTLVSALSSIPASGFTTAARVFKWQREYQDLSGITLRGTHDNAITRLTIRVTDGSQGANVWVDDMRNTGNYLSTPGGSSPTSTARRYYQYRVIQTSADPGVSSNFTTVTQNYFLGPSPNQLMRHGFWFYNGAAQPFYW